MAPAAGLHALGMTLQVSSTWLFSCAHEHAASELAQSAGPSQPGGRGAGGLGHGLSVGLPPCPQVFPLPFIFPSAPMWHKTNPPLPSQSVSPNPGVLPICACCSHICVASSSVIIPVESRNLCGFDKTYRNVFGIFFGPRGSLCVNLLKPRAYCLARF